ncbi:hypothetical protein SCG7109_AA_00440 [Chlamydiales bacterium SCGC AG-110-M15]|nr:hypothetical protein SCG7109_AA_00440 [Chlamydiales bacterium SCGC AG-110-M15]
MRQTSLAHTKIDANGEFIGRAEQRQFSIVPRLLNDAFEYIIIPDGKDPISQKPPILKEGAAENGLIAMGDCFEGLRLMHVNGVAHRDIKPENIMIDGDIEYDDNGKESAVKMKAGRLIDFDTCVSGNQTQAKIFGQEKLSRGTGGYMAPEIYDKSNEGDLFAADVFAMGVTCYYMLFPHLANGSGFSGENDAAYEKHRAPIYEPSIKQTRDRLIEEGNQHAAAMCGLILEMTHQDPSKRVSIQEATEKFNRLKAKMLEAG